MEETAADRRPPLFVHARAALEPLLGAGGYELAVEHFDYGNHGSAFAEYRRRGGRVRLIWDGKGCALWLESAPPQLENWRELEPAVRARARIESPDGAPRLDQLRALAERLAAEPMRRV